MPAPPALRACARKNLGQRQDRTPMNRPPRFAPLMTCAMLGLGMAALVSRGVNPPTGDPTRAQSFAQPIWRPSPQPPAQEVHEVPPADEPLSHPWPRPRHDWRASSTDETIGPNPSGHASTALRLSREGAAAPASQAGHVVRYSPSQFPEYDAASEPGDFDARSTRDEQPSHSPLAPAPPARLPDDESCIELTPGEIESDGPPTDGPLPDRSRTPDDQASFPGDTSFRILGQQGERLSIHVSNRDLREVLATLGEQAGVNILVSKGVHGSVSVSLNDVSLEGAVEAILRPTGYVSRRDGELIYVGSREDFQEVAPTPESIETRVDQSPAHAARQGIEPKLVCRPSQVRIESMIVSVKLGDHDETGVDFQLLRDQKHIRLAIDAQSPDLAGVDSATGELKFAFLDVSLGALLKSLESVGETAVISSPDVLLLDEQPAEVLLAPRQGKSESTSPRIRVARNSRSEKSGARLSLRPFIAVDGMILFAVHPALSDDQIVVMGDRRSPADSARAPTHVVVPNQATLIIGGLVKQQRASTSAQLPYLGRVPHVGSLLRAKQDSSERREILVLITPRIVWDDAAIEAGRPDTAETLR
jgi:Flp pilus assembly secretin CpaC